MRVHGIEMVQMQVANWSAAVDWYERIFRWQIAVREDADRFCLFVPPGSGSQLALYGPRSLTPGSPNRCVPSVRVEDLPRVLEQLRRRGVASAAAITGDADYRMTTIGDPEGNDIHLYEWLRRSGE